MDNIKYKILENVAIADIAIEAYGKDVNELFENAAFAIFEISADLSTIERAQEKNIELEADSLEDLLFDFLSEILYMKDTDSLIFHDVSVSVEEKDDQFELQASFHGEQINREKHALKADIKAITLHMFRIEETNDGYKATVVVDV